MISFSIALALLVLGYIFYGTFVARMFGQDPSRPTPATAMADGVDYVSMPTWKVYLIQFLNIAGLGPIFGAIMGIMFGPAAFLWIVFGTIFGGAVHDYLSGMLSLRSGGSSLPELVGSHLGGAMKNVVCVFTIILMILVAAVFVYNPADLMAMLTPGYLDRTFWVVTIFVYFTLAAMLPIDRLIGRIYPLFGFVLLFMALGLLVGLFVHADAVPEIWQGFHNYKADPEASPIFPMMFVSIACGAISGFHATQSPMMARCLRTERHARLVFYGAMVTEGIVALIWAAAAVAFAGSYENLQTALASGSPAVLVNEISRSWLGLAGGVLAILGVVAAPITSGDTALRSVRLIIADYFGLDQKKIRNRLLVTVPICALCFAVMMMPYEVLWRYFAWSNQVLATFTLWTLTVYLARASKPYVITLLPALFMTSVTATYILFAPEGLPLLLGALGLPAIPYLWAVGGGLIVSCTLLLVFARSRRPVGVAAAA